MPDPNFSVSAPMPDPKDVHYEMEKWGNDSKFKEKIWAHGAGHDFSIEREFDDGFVPINEVPEDCDQFCEDSEYNDFKNTVGKYLFAQRFDSIGNHLARYYSSAFSYFVKEGVDGVAANRHYEIDKAGKITVSRRVGYDSGADEKYDVWQAWDQANQCDRNAKLFLQYKKDHKTEYSDHFLMWCFESNYNGWFTSTIYLNKPRYDTTLVGQPAPQYPIEISGMSIRDDNADGTADRVDADWTRMATHGGFRLPTTVFCDDEDVVREGYLDHLLSYFDPILKDAKDTSVSYATYDPPVKAFVKKGDKVSVGDRLFAYMTENGVETIVSDVRGEVAELSSRGRLYLRIAK